MGCENERTSPELEAAQWNLTIIALILVASFMVITAISSLTYKYGEAAGELKAYKELHGPQPVTEVKNGL